MIVAEFILNLTNKEFSPLDTNVGGNILVVIVLGLLHIFPSLGQFQSGQVSLHVSILEEFDALVGEDFGHGVHILIRAPVIAHNFIIELVVVVLRAVNNTRVRSSSLAETKRNLKLLIFFVALRVLHILKNDAFLHLTDVFFLDNTDQRFETIYNLGRLDRIFLTDTLGQEILVSLVRELRNSIMRDGVNVLSESEFILNVLLSVLAEINSFLEEVRTLIEEEEGKTSNKLLLASRPDNNSKFLLLIVVTNDFNGSPGVLFLLEDWGKGMRLVRSCFAPFKPFFN